MKWQLFFLVVATLRIAGVAEAGPIGPMGRYYVTDESGFNRIWQFQGSSLTSFATVPAGGADGPIIVDGNAATDPVRSVKGGFSGGSGPSPGSSYDFAGTTSSGAQLGFFCPFRIRTRDRRRIRRNELVHCVGIIWQFWRVQIRCLFLRSGRIPV